MATALLAFLWQWLEMRGVGLWLGEAAVVANRRRSAHVWRSVTVGSHGLSGNALKLTPRDPQSFRQRRQGVCVVVVAVVAVAFAVGRKYLHKPCP